MWALLYAEMKTDMNRSFPHPEHGQLSAPEADPLENLLIEHPSMSVYQKKYGTSGAEEEELGSDEEEEDTPR